MEEYGTHNQPKGTWSDDSSMVLATLKTVNLGDDTDTVITGGIAGKFVYKILR